MAKSNAPSSFVIWAVWLLFLALPLFSLESLQDNALLSRFLVLGLGSALIVALQRDFFKDAFPRNISLVLILFGLFPFISMIWAYNTSEALALAGRFSAFIPVFFLFNFLLKKEYLKLDHLLKGLVIFGAASALPALFQLLKAMGNGAFFEDIYVIKGSFSHKNLLASALMLSFPFILAAWSLLKGAWSRMSMVLALIILVEMFVLRTRGVWLGLFGAAVFCVLVLQMQKPSDLKISRFWTISLSGAAVLILLALFLSPQIKAGFTNSSNIQKRMAYWENSWEMIQEHPISGVGGGNWKLLFPKYGLQGVDDSVMQGQTHIQRPHNDYLWLWSELGPMGLLLYLAIFVLCLVQILKNLKKLESREDRILNLAALFALVALAVFSMGDFPLERAPHTFLLMLIAAIAFSKSELKAQAGLASIIPVFILGGLLINGLRFNHEREAKTLIEIDYSGATLGQRMGNRNQQALMRERNRISAELSVQSEETYHPKLYTVDNYAMPIKYFDAKGKLFGAQSDLPAVKQAIDQAIEDAPYNILNYQILSEYFDRSGQEDSALFYIDRALSLSPQFNALIIKKAEIILRRKDHLQALAVLNLYPFQSQNPRYLDMLSQCLLKALQTYPAEHQQFAPMMQYFQQFNIDSREKLIAVYRKYREEKRAALLKS